jgi:DNA replication protein DnaC
MSKGVERPHEVKVRFPGIAPASKGAEKLRRFVASGAGAFGAPSAWLFLIRLHACRAGLRFTRHHKASLPFLPVNHAGPMSGPANSSLIQGDATMNDGLRNTLRRLRLSGLSQSLEVRLHEAQSHNLSHLEFLELILQDELLVRSQRLFNRRVQAASFREQRALDQFDWSFNPSIKKKQVFDLATGQFIREARDVLWLGPPGLGKSHLVQAIGYQVIKAGFVVLYRSIFDVVRDFLHDDVVGQDDKMLAHYLKPDLLIIDDMGMKQLPKRSGEYLFEIIMRRYEKRSTMMTSNRPLEDWGKLIGDVPAATAILDRFLHHAEIIQMTGKSYRLRNQAQQKDVEEDSSVRSPEKAKEATAKRGAHSPRKADTLGADSGSK